MLYDGRPITENVQAEPTIRVFDQTAGREAERGTPPISTAYQADIGVFVVPDLPPGQYSVTVELVLGSTVGRSPGDFTGSLRVTVPDENNIVVQELNLYRYKRWSRLSEQRCPV